MYLKEIRIMIKLPKTKYTEHLYLCAIILRTTDVLTLYFWEVSAIIFSNCNQRNEEEGRLNTSAAIQEGQDQDCLCRLSAQPTHLHCSTEIQGLRRRSCSDEDE